MNYIVFDLEMNNKWGTKIHEIIEIGAVKINAQAEIVDYFQSFVKPKLYPAISKLIKKKTQIKQEWINQAPELPHVINDFNRWIGREKFILCAWGIDDLLTLQRNFALNNINSLNYNFLHNYYDIQRDFMKSNNLTNQISLKNALAMLNTTPQYNIWHRAIYDAVHTAQIFVQLLDQTQKKLEPNIDPTKWNKWCS